ncbi:MAG: S-methyl-5'-thioadenosine phosphorylase [Deltaproteobacteria bacterium]|nr:S-methyl-5'-thioadenosine phosphorylase [Deltaproteobacteria bacterium]
MAERIVGVIGGSGLYELGGLQDVEELEVTTPFGPPSDRIVSGTLERVRLMFLPRHGRGHRLLPSEIPYRANIYALKKLGVERVISVSAVGSMRENLVPGDLMIPDQFFDRTQKRVNTFFGDGLVAHVSLADPVCAELSAILYESAREAEAVVHRGGTYLCIEGPAFSTRAESCIYQSWGVDVIGMTNLPEACLAREAELCYATLALVTDFDCWHSAVDKVTAVEILATFRRNVHVARQIIAIAVGKLGGAPSCACGKALSDTFISARERVSAATLERLAVIVGKYFL